MAELVAGVAGYHAVAAVWPNFYYTPITAGKITWLGLQAIIGIVCAYGGIKHATHVLTERGRASSMAS